MTVRQRRCKGPHRLLLGVEYLPESSSRPLTAAFPRWDGSAAIMLSGVGNPFPNPYCSCRWSSPHSQEVDQLSVCQHQPLIHVRRPSSGPRAHASARTHGCMQQARSGAVHSSPATSLTCTSDGTARCSDQCSYWRSWNSPIR